MALWAAWGALTAAGVTTVFAADAVVVAGVAAAVEVLAKLLIEVKPKAAVKTKAIIFFMMNPLNVESACIV